MQKILSYPISIIYYLFFGLTLIIFHFIQWFCFNLFGYKAHKISVDWMQFWLMRSHNILGTRHTIINPYKIETGQPLIIVSNHQSMYDISPIMWHFRKHHVKFVSKKELGKGFPGVSYNLRHGGSVLIDRKKPREAILAIKNFGEYIQSTNRAAVIFPEGTRSRNGEPKPFQKQGLLTLFKYIPNAVVVPLTINNSWKMQRYGKFPLGIGNELKFKVHQPLKIATFTNKEALIDNIEATITFDITL